MGTNHVNAHSHVFTSEFRNIAYNSSSVLLQNLVYFVVLCSHSWDPIYFHFLLVYRVSVAERWIRTGILRAVVTVFPTASTVLQTTQARHIQAKTRWLHTGLPWTRCPAARTIKSVYLLYRSSCVQMLTNMDKLSLVISIWKEIIIILK